MVKNWTCPCGAVNLGRQRACEVCGQERVGRQAAGKALDLRCSWITSLGLRCRQRADYGALDKSGLCVWHYDCRTAVLPRSAEEWPAFEEWWLAWYGPKAIPAFCTLEAHYLPSFLFELVCGRLPQAMAATACRVGNCPFRILEGPTTPREGFKAMRAMFAEMAERTEEIRL